MTPHRYRIVEWGWLLARAIVVAALMRGLPASAQLSGSAAIVSDYRFRGESLSDGKPAAQVAIAYDHPGGLYAGIFASTVQFVGEGSPSLQAVPFAGYTQRISSGRSVEVGVDYAAFGRDLDYDYVEAYVGFTVDNVSGRIYYAPDYFGRATSAFYAEINVSQRVFDRFDVLGHLGVLRPERSSATVDRSQFDIALGVGVDLYGFALRAAWVGTNTTRTVYPIFDPKHRNTIVLAVARPY